MPLKSVQLGYENGKVRVSCHLLRSAVEIFHCGAIATVLKADPDFLMGERGSEDGFSGSSGALTIGGNVATGVENK